ncbi:MAG: biotin transporter BioY [Lachnospiraceae bacterium]|nr:biotin transporter BioY [Lachnospiraceae bacterium]
MSEIANNKTTPSYSSSKTVNLVFIAMMTAVVCVLGPIAIQIPISPVPISLGTLGLYTVIYILGWKKALASCALYLLIGLTGAPVFTGFTGGIAKLFGPTGGYLIGYLPMAALIGFFLKKFKKKWLQFIGYILGTAVLYTFGTIWLAIMNDIRFIDALWAGVIPFIPGDIAKIMIAMILGPLVRKALNRASLMMEDDSF